MTSRDFVYWLQGSLEINESESISEKQSNIIKNHLEMVLHYDKIDNPNELNSSKSMQFSVWLMSCFDKGLFNKGVDEVQLKSIKAIIYDVFIHEIDPSFTDRCDELKRVKVNKELDELHNHHMYENGELMRC